MKSHIRKDAQQRGQQNRDLRKPAGTGRLFYITGMENYIYPSSYVIMAGILLAAYFVAWLLMQRRLAGIEANEVLKDRE